MSTGADEEGQSERRNVLSPDFRRLEFPSDTLSVRRFRILFPQRFDNNDGNIADGYASNDFFYPHSPDKPRHLVRLADMICDERVIADALFYKSCFVEQSPEILADDDREVVESSRKRLEESYLFFKLADSPETARRSDSPNRR